MSTAFSFSLIASNFCAAERGVFAWGSLQGALLTFVSGWGSPRVSAEQAAKPQAASAARSRKFDGECLRKRVGATARR